ncbi:MAG: right-handed parallel beta-helix repeat-containing protein, partial [Bacteroidota bacterium]
MRKLIFILFVLPNLIYAQYDEYKIDALVTPQVQGITITVGGEQADVDGFSNKAIQLAVNALPAEGGIVQLNDGIFELKDAVHLRSNVKLIGSGASTVLKRAEGFRSRLIDDADYGELKLMVEDASGFEPGMSVQIWDEPQSSCWDVSVGTITDIVDNILYIDSYLIRDYRADRGGWVSNAGSGVLIKEAENVVVTNLVIDGNKEHHEQVDGCNGGGVAVFKSQNITIDNIHVKDFNGEGITWQITENVTVQNCEIEGSANMGMHPGTGSPKSRILNNNSHHNAVDGMFICWRVHHSIVKGNQFHHNGRYGICTGHKDSDVVFEENHIFENGSDGINLRGENSRNSPHRNTFLNNLIENNGQDGEGYGFAVYSTPQDLVIKDNTIRDTDKGTQKAGVFLQKDVPEITL